MIIVNGFQPLTIITKCSIFDVAVVLDPILHTPVRKMTSRYFYILELFQFNPLSVNFTKMVERIQTICRPFMTILWVGI